MLAMKAARAGEAGRSLLVAQEVRELAQRSAAAAKDIKCLIGNSGAKVKDGVRLVMTTGDALKEIQQLVTAIDHNVDAIATAAHERSVGVRETNKAVN